MALIVSIQLVSPASGDGLTPSTTNEPAKRFHSISFPSEWGRADQAKAKAHWE